MSRAVRIDIERVVVTGTPVDGLDVMQLRSLVGQEVATGLANIDLPRGRTMRMGVRLETGSLGTTAASVSRAVGSGIVTAIQGEAGVGHRE